MHIAAKSLPGSMRSCCTQHEMCCMQCRHGPRWNPAEGHEAVPEVSIAVPVVPEQAHHRSRNMEFLFLGAAVALAAQYAVQWLGHLPWWQRISRRFIWWRPEAPPHSPYGSYAGQTCMLLFSYITSMTATCRGCMHHAVVLLKLAGSSTCIGASRGSLWRCCMVSPRGDMHKMCCWCVTTKISSDLRLYMSLRLDADRSVPNVC